MTKTAFTSLIVAAGIVVLGFVLNPSAEKHRDKIKSAVSERSQMERAFGVGQVIAFASRYHTLGVASYTTVSDKVTSVGMMGLVFVMD